MPHNVSPEILFSESRLSEVYNDSMTRTTERAEKLVADEITRHGVDALADRIANDLSFDLPTLGEPEIGPPHDVAINGRMATVADVEIPFTGGQGVFRCQPSTYSSSAPRGVVTHGKLTITIALQGARGVELRSAIDAEVAKIQQYLTWAKKDLDRLNAALREKARAAVEARKRRLDEAEDAVASTGIKRKDR